MWQGLSSSTEAPYHSQKRVSSARIQATQAPQPSWGSPMRLWAYFFSHFQMAETNLFFVLFSGWRCPSQKLRTHLFWGINQNLPPSSQEPTEDVLPLWSPACLLQEGNLTSQAQLLSIAMLKNLSKLPFYPFVSLILTGVLWALGTEIFMCIHCSLSFLWHPGAVCAPDRSNKLQELTTGLILKAREEGIALLLGLVYGFIVYISSMSIVNHFLLNVFFQLHFHMRLIAYSESNCSFHEELRALTVNKTIMTSYVSLYVQSMLFFIT